MKKKNFKKNSYEKRITLNFFLKIIKINFNSYL